MENETSHGEFSDCGNSLEIIKNEYLKPIKLQINDVSFDRLDRDEELRKCRESQVFINKDFPNEPDNHKESSDDKIFKLDSLFKNFKESLICERPIKSVIENTELQSRFGEVSGLESERKVILTEDETENCILEHKSINNPVTFNDFNPTGNSFSVLNTLSFLDKKIEMLKENKNRTEQNTADCEKLEKSKFWNENTEEFDFNHSKGRTLESENKNEVKNELNQPHKFYLSDDLLMYTTLKLDCSRPENLTNKDVKKQDSPCGLVKPYTNSDENKHEDVTTKSLKVTVNLDSDNNLHALKTLTSLKSDKEVENNMLKLEDESSSSEKVSASVCNMEVDIHEAIRCGDETLVRKLLAEGADPNEPDWGGKGDPPIVQAALKQDTPIVKALCEAGCDVNQTSVRGESALHMVVSRRPVNLPLLDTLLAAGCNPNVQDKLRGCSPLHCVSGFADDEPEVFRRLVVVTDVNLRDHRHCTVLHRVAASSYNVAWIKQLLELGADPNMQNDRGETALCVALERGWTEGALALVAGTELSSSNLYRETALHVAARHDQADVVAALLRHNADVNAQDLAGNTALHLAAGRGYADTVRQLLACPSLDLDTYNCDNATPLTCAVESGFITVVQMLIQANQVDLKPALDVAKQGYRRLSQPEMCQLLTEELARRQTPHIN